jgi:hypothetical protein
MVRTYAIQSSLLITIFLVFTTSALAAQNTSPSTRPAAGAEFLPEAGLSGGVFLFERGTRRPTHMDVFDGRPVVKSPDGKLGVTVTGPKQSYGAWVTLSPSKFPDGPVQVWPMQASVAVLWTPDGQAFALTDKRYANLSYVLVCGTEFRMGEDGAGLGVAITDFTPIVRKAFEERAQKFYAGSEYETRLFYAMALRWIGDDELLVGVSATIAGPPTLPNRGVKEWEVAYLVDVPNGKVVREVGEDQLLSEYRIKVYDY